MRPGCTAYSNAGVAQTAKVQSNAGVAATRGTFMHTRSLPRRERATKGGLPPAFPSRRLSVLPSFRLTDSVYADAANDAWVVTRDERKPRVSDKTVKTAVVGVALIGEQHAGAYHDYHRSDLVMVHDLNADRARAVAEQYGCKATSNIDDIANSDAE